MFSMGFLIENSNGVFYFKTIWLCKMKQTCRKEWADKTDNRSLIEATYREDVNVNLNGNFVELRVGQTKK